MHENSILRMRRERRWSQLQLLHQLDRAAKARRIALPDQSSLRITLSGWENARHRPSLLYRQLLAEAFEVTEAELGFGDPYPPPTTSVGSGAVSYLSSMFALHAPADQDLGSQLLINVVSEQTKQAERWAQEARGSLRDPLLRVVSR
jgi:transcriptional regulator with XRE-family HTH domain